MSNVSLSEFEPLTRYKSGFLDSPLTKFQDLHVEDEPENKNKENSENKNESGQAEQPKFKAPLLYESSVLSWQKLPPMTYFPEILKGDNNKILNKGLKKIKGKLSRPKTPRLLPCQIEALIYIMQRFTGPALSNETKPGFFLGDSTGVGKSRVIAAVFQEMFVTGHKKGVWISSSSKLYTDVKKELDQIFYSGTVISQNDFPSENKRRSTPEETAESEDEEKPEETPISTEPENEDEEEQEETKSTVRDYADLDESANLVFTAYSMLRGKDHIRLYQLLRWLGNGFDGVIAFDECHLAKGESESSATRDVVQKLQTLFPKAAVLYVSATAGHQPTHLAYMDRLGLWGPNCVFKDAETFVEKMKMRKLSGMEVITLELKRVGAFVARQLSMKNVDCELVTAVLSPDNKALYNKCVEIWQLMYEILDTEEQRIEKHRYELQRFLRENTSEPERRMKKSECPRSEKVNLKTHQYWADHQRFFLSLLTSFKSEALKKIKEAHPPTKFSLVVCLQSTGSNQMNCIDQDLIGASKRPYSLCWAKLRSVMTKLKIQPAVRNPGETGDDQSLDTLEKDDEKRMRIRQLYREIEDYLPRNAVDVFIDVLGGVDAVAEITGRRKRQIWNGEKYMCLPIYDSMDQGSKICNDYVLNPLLEMQSHTLTHCLYGKSIYQPAAKPSDQLINSLKGKVNYFMEGLKKAAIVSQAGSTGINLHDERGRGNATQRVQVCVECPWIAESGLQQFGRTNRGNQRTSPKFKLLITDIKGELRFYSSFLERVQKLGAMTQADRRAVALNFDIECSISDDNAVASKAAMETVKIMFKKKSELPDVWQELLKTGLIVESGPTKFADCIETFLNRMLGCTVNTQELLHDKLKQYYTMMKHQAKDNGDFDEGMQGISKRWRLTWLKETVFEPTGEGPVLMRLRVDRGMSWKEFQEFVAKYKHDKFNDEDPVYSKNGDEIKAFFPIETSGYDADEQKCQMVNHFCTYSPLDQIETVVLAEKMNPFTKGWEQLDALEAEKSWTSTYEKGADGSCIHRFRSQVCPNENCTDGARTFNICIISQCLLEAWDVVYTCLSAKKIRVQTVGVSCIKDGHSMDFVGIFVPRASVTDVIEALSHHARLKLQKVSSRCRNGEEIDNIDDEAGGDDSENEAIDEDSDGNDSDAMEDEAIVEDGGSFFYSVGENETNDSTDSNEYEAMEDDSVVGEESTSSSSTSSYEDDAMEYQRDSVSEGEESDPIVDERDSMEDDSVSGTEGEESDASDL